MPATEATLTIAPFRRLAIRTPAARAKERAAQVDIDLAVPLLHAYPLQRMHLAEHAGGVDKSSDRTMGGLDIGDTCGHAAFARDIERRGPEDGVRSREWLRRDIDDEDTLSAIGEQGRSRSANAAAAAGHEHKAVSAHRYSPRMR
jgi:hypothetical protein